MAEHREIQGQQVSAALPADRSLCNEMRIECSLDDCACTTRDVIRSGSLAPIQDLADRHADVQHRSGVVDRYAITEPAGGDLLVQPLASLQFTSVMHAAS